LRISEAIGVEIQNVFPYVDLVEMERTECVAAGFAQSLFPASQQHYASVGDSCAGGIQYDSREHVAVRRFPDRVGGLARIRTNRQRNAEAYDCNQG